MIDIGERIQRRRNKLGWSQADLARRADVHPSKVSRVEGRKGRLSEEDLHKVAGALGLSAEKLYASDGNVVDAAPDNRRIPVLDYVQAGHWLAVRSARMDDEIRETITTNLDCPPSTFALKIRGDSMSPEFREGDIVVIVPSLAPQPGDFVVATDESGEATFKKFRSVGLDGEGRSVFELVPLNSDYGSIRSDQQAISVVGTMIEHRRYRRR